jgi:hypothetical protein
MIEFIRLNICNFIIKSNNSQIRTNNYQDIATSAITSNRKKYSDVGVTFFIMLSSNLSCYTSFLVSLNKGSCFNLLLSSWILRIYVSFYWIVCSNFSISASRYFSSKKWSICSIRLFKVFKSSITLYWNYFFFLK